MEPVDEESVNLDMMTSSAHAEQLMHARMVNPARLTNQRRAVRIDEFCRFIFPLGFIFFNIFYWNYYKEVDDVD